MKEPRKRKPPTYPALLRDTLNILAELRDGGRLKKSRDNDSLTFGGYVVHINSNVFTFYRYRDAFLTFTINSELPLELEVHTGSYVFDVRDNEIIRIGTPNFEMPLSKSDHFNIMVMDIGFPEWEDVEYLNLIYKVSKELKLSNIRVLGTKFYP